MVFNESLNPDEKKMPEKRNGTVEVWDGQIIIKNPTEGGEQAKISPGSGLKLFVDGVEVKNSKPVSEGCKITAEIEAEAPERDIVVTVENVNMTAYAAVIYKNGEKYKLRDVPSSNEIRLEAEYEGIERCMPYTLDEASEIIGKKGIVYGIIPKNLENAIAGSGGRVLIAKGLDPVDAEADRVAAVYESKAENKYVEVKDRIDFYSIGKIVSVNPQDLVAEKIPGSEGSPGTDVYGKTIKQKSTKRIKLIAGKGVIISEDGLKAYSKILGRPEIRENVVSVHEVYEIPLNVDVSTGNIEFAGDVVVKGNVLEGMKIKAGGNVSIYGSITDGEIKAGGNVSVHNNIIGSRITAGCNDILRFNIIEHLESFRKYLNELFSAVEVLKETGKIPKTYKDGQILKLLLDTKFRKVYACVEDFRHLLSDNRDFLDDDSIRLGARIIKYFSGNGPLLVENISELTNLAELCAVQIAVFEGQLKEPSKIEANYVQNSSLDTSGDIIIFGKGCYNSTLYCKKEVCFKKPGSVMRGGSIDAGGNVRIYELGSPGGAVTTVSTGKGSEIICETAYINSVIKIGSMSSRLEVSARKLKAYLYKGELMIEKSKV